MINVYLNELCVALELCHKCEQSYAFLCLIYLLPGNLLVVILLWLYVMTDHHLYPTLLQYRLTVPKAGRIFDLCSALTQATDVPPNQVYKAFTNTFTNE